MATQTDIFSLGEGDRYFERNRSAYQDEVGAELTPGLALCLRYLQPDSKMLEIGCANGMNLAHLAQATGCLGYGLDPSIQAIESGRSQFPSLQLTVGTADTLPYPDGYFNLVLLGFCLYVIDRALLPRIVAEVDRVLADKGVLVITDFDPDVPTRRPYQHCPGVFSFKLDYARLFTAYPQYSLVDKLSYSHSGDVFELDSDKRLTTQVLFKSLAQGYGAAT